MAKEYVEKAVVDLIVNGRSAELSVKDLGGALKKVNDELKAMAEADDPAKYQRLLKEKQKISEEYARQRKAIGDLRTEWQKFTDEFTTIAMGVVGGNAITWAIESAINFLPEQIDRIIKKKDELADVAKTTNMTDREVRALRQNLKEVDTRTTLSDLMSLAEVGGQFGVAKKEIEGFTTAADQANVALGKSFGGAAQTGEALFKTNNILKDIEGSTVGERMLHIANALNVLEAEGAATANGITDLANRIGGVLAPMGVGSDFILGMSATLEELGVTAERGGTAVVDIFQKMLTETETFAKVAGMSTADFEALIRKDMPAAFGEYVKGLKKVQGDQLDFQQVMNASKLTGSGVSEVLGKLVSNYDMLNSKVERTGEVLKSTDSITDEFKKKNFDLAIQLKQVRQFISELFVSDTIEEYIGRSMAAVTRFLPVLKTLGHWLGEQRMLWQVLGTALLVYYGNVIKATIATAANTTVTIAQRVAYQAGYYWLVLNETATKAYALAQAVLTGRITAAAAAQRLWTAALNANPLGAVIVLLSAFTAALKLYSDNTQEALAIERKKRDLSVLLTQTLSNHEKAQKGLNSRIAQYNTLSESERESLKKEIILRQQKLKAQLKNIEAQRIELSQMAAQPSLWQKFVGMLTSGGVGPNFAANMAQAAAENMQTVNEKFNGQISQLKDYVEAGADMIKQIEAMDKALSNPTNPGFDPDSLGGDDGKDKKKKTKKDTSKIRYDGVKELDFSIKPQDLGNEVESDMKGYFDHAMIPAEGTYAGQLYDINSKQATRQISEADAYMQKLSAEEQYLNAKLMLEKRFGQQTLDTEKQLQENMVAQLEHRYTRDKELKDAMRQAEWELQDAKRDALAMGISLLSSFVSESSALYKLLFIGEKAAAVAGILVNMTREISGIRANPFVLAMPPGVREAYIAKTILSAKFNAAVGVANIAKQTFEQLVPKKAQGGYTDVRSLAEGFVNRATLFSMPNRQYIAGEAGQEFILNNRSLQYPAVAKFANMLDAVQKSRNYGLLNTLNGKSNSDDSAIVVAEIRALREDLNKLIKNESSRPVIFNTKTFDKHRDFLYKIQNDVNV